LLETYTQFLEQNNLNKEAAEAYKSILSKQPTNKNILCKLIIALSQFDVEAAKKLESKLPNIPTSDQIDVEKLEDLPFSKVAAQSKSSTNESKTEEKKKKKS